MTVILSFYAKQNFLFVALKSVQKSLRCDSVDNIPVDFRILTG